MDLRAEQPSTTGDSILKKPLIAYRSLVNPLLGSCKAIIEPTTHMLNVVHLNRHFSQYTQVAPSMG
jgi:hypothetical protein